MRAVARFDSASIALVVAMNAECDERKVTFEARVREALVELNGRTRSLDDVIAALDSDELIYRKLS